MNVLGRMGSPHLIPLPSQDHAPTPRSCLCIHLASLGFLVGTFNPFIFRIIIDICAPFRRRQWHPTPVLLPGKSHGQRSLEGCSPWGRQESDMTSLPRIGEGNGNPLQCSCLKNPRDGGAWSAAVYGVAQSQTGLKRLSSSSSSAPIAIFLIVWSRFCRSFFFSCIS